MLAHHDDGLEPALEPVREVGEGEGGQARRDRRPEAQPANLVLRLRIDIRVARRCILGRIQLVELTPDSMHALHESLATCLFPEA